MPGGGFENVPKWFSGLWTYSTLRRWRATLAWSRHSSLGIYQSHYDEYGRMRGELGHAWNVHVLCDGVYVGARCREGGWADRHGRHLKFDSYELWSHCMIDGHTFDFALAIIYMDLIDGWMQICWAVWKVFVWRRMSWVWGARGSSAVDSCASECLAIRGRVVLVQNKNGRFGQGQCKIQRTGSFIFGEVWLEEGSAGSMIILAIL